jgi:hypothetical protein
MKKLLIAATLATTALGATSLFAYPGHRSGQAGREATQTQRHADMQKRMQENHARTSANEHGGNTGHQAQMQKRMQENHARMAANEHDGQGRGRQERGHQH